MDPQTGLLLTLDRDDAKRLFSAKGDEALESFLYGFIADEKNRKNGKVFSLQSNWQLIHACLCCGELSADGGELPLNQCLLGGRQLHSRDEFIARLVRPDMVQHIAAYKELDEMQTKAVYDSLDPTLSATHKESWEDLWHQIQNMIANYQSAAAAKAAVLFFAQR